MNYEDAQAWRDALKVGDEVFISGRWGSSIDTVARVTQTQVVAGNQKFRKSNGHALGSDIWNIVTIGPVTPALRDGIELGRLRKQVGEWAVKGDLATLRLIEQLIKERSNG